MSEYTVVRDLIDNLFIYNTYQNKTIEAIMFTLLLTLFLFQLVLDNDQLADDFYTSWNAQCIRCSCFVIILIQLFNLRNETASMGKDFCKHFNYQNTIDFISIFVSFIYCFIRMSYPFGAHKLDEYDIIVLKI